MYPPQIAEIRARLIQTLPRDPDAISALADRIQKLARHAPLLTAGCEFSQAQAMRRLLILPVKAWTDNDAHRAQYALAAIERLQADPAQHAALALACYGIERADLPAAIALLEQARDAPQPAPQPTPDDPALAPKTGKQRSRAAIKPLESLDDEAALDPETQAALDDLKREVQGLTKAG